MELLQTLVLGFIGIVLVNNLVFSKFLGICPYLGVSGRIDMAFGMGCAVTFVVTLAGTLTWLIDHMILMKYDLEVLRYLCFILVIAGAVQLVEMYVRKFFPALYESFGIFLPLITVNCAILGASLFMVIRNYTFIQTIGYGFGAGLGWMLAILAMAGIRTRLNESRVPEGLRGPGITLIIAGLMALAFIGFTGVLG